MIRSAIRLTVIAATLLALAAPALAQAPSSSSTTTSVASNAAEQLLLAPNGARKAGTIVNDSTAILYLKLTGGVSSSSYWVAVAAKGTTGVAVSLPVNYTGPVYGIWATANGAALVTEVQ